MKKKFIRVKIDNISIFNYNFIVLLKREGDERVLPICIGAAEAHSIAAAYNRKSFPRPLTHDLMRNVLDELDCRLDRIHVTELKDGTFYARIYLTTGDGRTLDIDSRPSDAMALALRYEAPIFVREDVIEENAVEIAESGAQAVEEKEEDEDESADPLTKLKKQLDKAVREERYEDAARLRDELQRLQGN